MTGTVKYKTYVYLIKNIYENKKNIQILTTTFFLQINDAHITSNRTKANK